MTSKLSIQELAKCADCACFNIRKASRVVTQVYEELMTTTGLRGTQFTVLVMVAAYNTMTISFLADKLVMDRTTLTRTLKPLEKNGLIEIVAGEEDRRTRVVKVTEAGHEMLTIAMPLWRKGQEKIVKFMGEDRFGHLLSELHSLEKIADTK